ncbi:FGGY family carbohydrate kinase, partial [Domibacillus aminovorans]|uniref:FGGY family carbohydrate kinase n=1 Tax=Domibacillus aminovorans TaxID=29332 RepID=UPI001FD52F63
MSYLMGIDLGTSSVKTVIMDENGSIKGTAQQSYEIIIEKSGYAEQDPNVWWKAVVLTIKHVLNKTGIHSKKIKGIGFSGQMHGLVMIDRNLLPIRPAIIWSDQRSRKEVAEIYSLAIHVAQNQRYTTADENVCRTGIGYYGWERKVDQLWCHRAH